MPPDDNDLRTIKSAAQKLKVSTAQIYRLARAGELELLKIGQRGTRVTGSSLDNYIANAKRVTVKRKD